MNKDTNQDTNQSKSELYREKILSMFKTNQVAWYLHEELEAILGYLHYYKLRNILKNGDLLVKYLSFLDEQNNKQFKKLIKQYKSSKANDLLNLEYFVSKESIEELGEQELLNILHNKTAQHIIQNILLSIKWLLLLTANEFCHASTTRISLNRLERERRENKNKSKANKINK